MFKNETQFKDLIGKICSKIKETDDEIVFITNDGNYRLFHADD